ncbi:CCA tRNA nucleotidyltransferase [Stappia sp. F7233]|uniref:CCA tRNA nucleotidyltransferase n=1 Tax=Stappia albiluteola TaxID=2758565 RepID=A0A839AAE5_9HYPH|nr:CCA tRNA nucleotidyltransferase [Stappia albiluteola]MBA5775729.1 CCA tRNA nucleotidyltransferase [Stappia albiluteola]
MAETLNPDWLASPSIQAVFDALEVGGDQARAVGGAVRNTLLRVPVSDIDISTTAVPQEVIARAEAAGMRAIPTGIDHGTITVISRGVAYEVTTLREDVETHGRHATVRFGSDWLKDAERRDFTMNALYVDRQGRLYDPVGGLPDLRHRQVRFIGDPAARIAEDYLRILRFFRFHAQYGSGALDAAGLHAAIEARDGLRRLSAERIGMEMRKLVSAPAAADTVSLMADIGIIEIVLAGVARIVDFRNLRRLDIVAHETRAPSLGLAALAGFIDEDIERISTRMRLSNAERKRMLHALHMADRFGKQSDTHQVREMIYRTSREAVVDGILLAWARQGGDPMDRRHLSLLQIAHSFIAPVFPVKGKDLVALGIPRGPQVGERLSELEAHWIEQDFRPGRDELLGAVEISRS